MTQPFISEIDNQSGWWAVLAVTAEDGSQGQVAGGNYTSAETSLTLERHVGIPPSGSDQPRMFLMTSANGFRLTATDQGDGTFEVVSKWNPSGVKGAQQVAEGQIVDDGADLVLTVNGGGTAPTVAPASASVSV